jgi:hypothetical protein
MKARRFTTVSLFACSALLAGCANANNPLATASVSPDKPSVVASKVDPVCVSLSGQIETLRKESAVEGLEKAATGKGTSVKVKRTSLAKQAELNKANADFQTKCGPVIPKPQTAQAAPLAATGAAQTASAVATTAAAAAPGAVASQAKAAVTATAQTAVQAAAAPKN